MPTNEPPVILLRLFGEDDMIDINAGRLFKMPAMNYSVYSPRECFLDISVLKFFPSFHRLKCTCDPFEVSLDVNGRNDATKLFLRVTDFTVSRAKRNLSRVSNTSPQPNTISN